MNWLKKSIGNQREIRSENYYCYRVGYMSPTVLVFAKRLKPFESLGHFGTFTEAKATCEEDARKAA